VLAGPGDHRAMMPFKIGGVVRFQHPPYIHVSLRNAREMIISCMEALLRQAPVSHCQCADKTSVEPQMPRRPSSHESFRTKRTKNQTELTHGPAAKGAVQLQGKVLATGSSSASARADQQARSASRRPSSHNSYHRHAGRHAHAIKDIAAEGAHDLHFGMTCRGLGSIPLVERSATCAAEQLWQDLSCHNSRHLPPDIAAHGPGKRRLPPPILSGDIAQDRGRTARDRGARERERRPESAEPCKSRTPKFSQFHDARAELPSVFKFTEVKAGEMASPRIHMHALARALPHARRATHCFTALADAVRTRGMHAGRHPVPRGFA